MKLFVGLGNPGARYAGTRHNTGFRVIDAFAERFRIDVSTHEKEALTGKGRVSGRSVVLAKPLTFMNLSGDAVGKLVRHYIGDPMDLVVVYDDVDLQTGKLRIKPSGSAGTHNGMRSIVAALETENFPRLRFGIRGESHSASRDLADYVLEDFSTTELEEVERGIERAVEALAVVARDDLDRAMSQFNRDPLLPQAESSEGAS
jgi:peptidyl-tRNA hydrolase, PTH1 family